MTAPDPTLATRLAELDQASAFMADLHKELCFENGDHPLEVDTAYSLAEYALHLAKLSSKGQLITLADAEAMVRAAVAKAVEAERADAVAFLRVAASDAAKNAHGEFGGEISGLFKHEANGIEKGIHVTAAAEIRKRVKP